MKLLRRIDYWLHHRKRDAELAEELEFHRAMATDSAQLACRTTPRSPAKTRARHLDLAVA